MRTRTFKGSLDPSRAVRYLSAHVLGVRHCLTERGPRVTSAREPLDPVFLGDIFDAGGEALAREVADTFLKEAVKRRATLDAALDAGDWSGAALAAHAIISGSSMLGLTLVADAARQIELMMREQRRPPKAILLALDGAVETSREVLARAIAAEVARRKAGP